MRSESKYSLLATDGELKRQLKARQCHINDPSLKDNRSYLMQVLAENMKASRHQPIITHCKLSGIHCLVVTNSMKPSQLIWGFHGRHSNSWNFLTFAQVLCYCATEERLGVCVVLPFGAIDLSSSNVQRKEGPHMWYDTSESPASSFDIGSTFAANVSRTRTTGAFKQKLLDKINQKTVGRFQTCPPAATVQQLQQAVDASCKSLRIPDTNLALIGFDQGAVVALELTLRLRAPPIFVALWGIALTQQFLKRPDFDALAQEVKIFRTKSSQILVCHGEKDSVTSLADVLTLRTALNSWGYKTLSFTHPKGHEVPDQVQKVTIDSFIDRIKKMNRKGYPPVPLVLHTTCGVIPFSEDVPRKSECLTTGEVHTSVAKHAGDHYPGTANKIEDNRRDTKRNLPSAYGDQRAPEYGGAEESKFVHNTDITLEDPALRFSQMVMGESSSNDPTIFNVQKHSTYFGVDSIWDPKGFQTK